MVVSPESNVINVTYLKQEVLVTTKVTVTGEWNNVNSTDEVIVVITNLITGKKYNGILKYGQDEKTIFKYLPLGNYSISCMDALNMHYTGSDINNNVFTLSDSNNEMKIVVTNTQAYPEGFHSLDSADNPMRISIQ